jgi:hypothetical protein
MLKFALFIADIARSLSAFTLGSFESKHKKGFIMCKGFLLKSLETMEFHNANKMPATSRSGELINKSIEVPTQLRPCGKSTALADSKSMLSSIKLRR